MISNLERSTFTIDRDHFTRSNWVTFRTARDTTRNAWIAWTITTSTSWSAHSMAAATAAIVTNAIFTSTNHISIVPDPVRPRNRKPRARKSGSTMVKMTVDSISRAYLISLSSFALTVRLWHPCYCLQGTRDLPRADTAIAPRVQVQWAPCFERASRGTYPFPCAARQTLPER